MMEAPSGMALDAMVPGHRRMEHKRVQEELRREFHFAFPQNRSECTLRDLLVNASAPGRRFPSAGMHTAPYNGSLGEGVRGSFRDSDRPRTDVFHPL